MMELCFLRHGIAVPRDLEKDSERPLTSVGRKKIRAIARSMRSANLSFDLILSSPYVRARQTAEIVVRILQVEKRLQFSSHLAADGRARDLICQLKDFQPAPARVLLVGHEPYLSELISTLLTGRPDLSLNLKKGGLCRLTVNCLHHGRCAALEWLVTPKLLLAS